MVRQTYKVEWLCTPTLEYVSASILKTASSGVGLGWPLFRAGLSSYGILATKLPPWRFADKTNGYEWIHFITANVSGSASLFNWKQCMVKLYDDNEPWKRVCIQHAHNDYDPYVLYYPKFKGLMWGELMHAVHTGGKILVINTPYIWGQLWEFGTGKLVTES